MLNLIIIFADKKLELRKLFLIEQSSNMRQLAR